MDQRPSPRCGRLFATLLLLAALASSAGCRSALATAIWLIQGPDLPAEFKELKGKQVCVVCRPLVELTYRDSNAAKDLAREITRLLAANVRDVRMVDQRKVDAWIDENVWEEYNEVGRAMKADYVVGVDLERFSIFQGQTVYQGKANVAMKVFDCKSQSKEPVFDRRLPQVVYPPNSPRSTGDQQESDFRREYVRVLADQIARHFYPHDPYADVALDAAYLH